MHGSEDSVPELIPQPVLGLRSRAVTRRDKIRLTLGKKSERGIQSLLVGMEQVQPTHDSMNSLGSADLTHMADGIDQARVAASTEDNQTLACFEPQGQIVCNRIRMILGHIEEERTPCVLKGSEAGNWSSHPDAGCKFAGGIELNPHAL